MKNNYSNLFIRKAGGKHNNKYDYSDATYVNTTTKIKIICPIHGPFTQSPKQHLVTSGCAKCSTEVRSDKQRMLQTDFIAIAGAIHHSAYDYSQVRYINTDTPVSIWCQVHGRFDMTPYGHTRQQYGCPTCGVERRVAARKTPIDEFLKNAKQKHGDKYDYSNIQYVNTKTPIVIICPTHGAFNQPPGMHLRHGCAKCALAETHKSKLHTTASFIDATKRVHGNLYNYSQVQYENSKTPVRISCKKHGIFTQRPSNHLSGQGCPTCRASKGELMVASILSEMNTPYIAQYVDDKCRYKKPLRFDFLLPGHNMLIEYQGVQHYNHHDKNRGPLKHINYEDLVIRDNIKKQFAITHNYLLLEIPYWASKREAENLVRNAMQTQEELTLFNHPLIKTPRDGLLFTNR